jgi:hypothetical protein
MGLEVAEVFRQYGPAYRAKYGAQMLPSHRQVMRAIEQCRTAALGGRVYHCQACDAERYSYHSCRNRHCPKCQAEEGQRWLERQAEWLLPVPYFLLTFTLPADFRAVARRHQKQLYAQLFRISAAATQALALDPRYVGGAIGMIGVLHTWGRNLSYHPHVHYLVPAGGLTAAGTWRATRADFLVPVKALSKLFRGKLREALKGCACSKGIPATVWKQAWVVHCEPVGSGVAALKYLAPYIFRVALSNKRLLKLAEDQVTFRYQATDTGQERQCTLGAEEFIHRFLQHVLPKGFVKVRYYGLFSPGQRQRLAQVRSQLGGLPAEPPLREGKVEVATSIASLAATTALAQVVLRCPKCGQPMQPGRLIPPTGRAPP